MKTVYLKNVEKEYQKAIEQLVSKGVALSPDDIVELSKILYSDIKVRGISAEDSDNDMLLFQYGTYNWGGELGEHFSFDITRQFSKKNFDMFQLSLTLVFEPTHFKELDSYNSWSSDFKNIEEWIENIKNTHGYQLAKSQPIKTYQLIFTQV
ncbi:hypothetical protein ACFFLS_04700 [Flavobacterium procerum]|uniref:Uncharacterized protein n=1 Tax=Flavobacterium procerum TaxID=1455569 RepID=A0ABV6BLK5_9FLAO